MPNPFPSDDTQPSTVGGPFAPRQPTSDTEPLTIEARLVEILAPSLADVKAGDAQNHAELLARHIGGVQKRDELQG